MGARTGDVELRCVGCASLFIAGHGHQKYCTPACRLSANASQLSERYHSDSALRERLKLVAKRKQYLSRKWIECQCSVCGVKYSTWKLAHSLTCDKACAAELQRRRRRQWNKEADQLLGARIRSKMRESLIHGKAGRKWESLVGYSLRELMEHLQRQFLPGMSWANMSEWHIDHIRPLASFGLRSVDDPRLREAWCLTNLRPIWSEDNIKKGSKRMFLI